jgi:hypothetical protein
MSLETPDKMNPHRPEIRTMSWRRVWMLNGSRRIATQSAQDDPGEDLGSNNHRSLDLSRRW